MPLLLLTLVACLRAARPLPGAPEVWEGPRMSFEVPEGWTITRNGRALGNHWVTLSSPDRTASISLELTREDRRSRGLPLDLLAEVMPVETGRSLGVETRPLALHQLEVAHREAWATTSLRRHGPHQITSSAVMLRGQRHLAVLTLLAAPDAPGATALAWERVLSSFDLPRDPAPEVAPFLREAADDALLEQVGFGGGAP